VCLGGGGDYYGQQHTDMTLSMYSKAVPGKHRGGPQEGKRYNFYSFLTSTLDGDEWSASQPGCALLPGESTPGSHWIGGCVDPRTGLETEARKKLLLPCQGSNPSHIVQSVIRLLY
jgi:hypothetical protein